MAKLLEGRPIAEKIKEQLKEEIENLQKVGTWASYLTLAVTFALAIFLALLSKGPSIDSPGIMFYVFFNDIITVILYNISREGCYLFYPSHPGLATSL